MTSISGRSSRITLPVAALVVGAVAILARAYVFGNPIVQIDEQFYLLVGKRMIEGAVPYVDIFDRKPVGLFLLYAAFRALGGTGVWTYQIAALLSVWATALLLFAMARRVAPAPGALAAAILYVLWLNLAGGEAGQAPVYYNLPVAAAIALILFRKGRAAERGGDLRGTGLLVMLLFGVAMQIKYSAVFEGVFAGLMLLAISRKAGRPIPKLAVDASLWVAAALAPTQLAALAYVAMGYGQEWWFANISSILLRGAEPPVWVAMRVKVMSFLLVPLLLCWPLRRWTGARPTQGQREDMRFLDIWAASALLGVILFGTWFNHYALPLFAPLAVIAAPLWSSRGGKVWLGLMLVAGAIKGQHMLYRHGITRGDARVLAGATAAAADHHGCLFVYDGLPALYDTTNSCFLTSRNFPAHLQSVNEIGATGIDEAGEVARVMRGLPDRVMTMEPAYEGENLQSRAALYRVLTPRYQEMFRYTGSEHNLVVYGLKGTVHRPPVLMAADRSWP